MQPFLVRVIASALFVAALRMDDMGGEVKNSMPERHFDPKTMRRTAELRRDPKEAGRGF